MKIFERAVPGATVVVLLLGVFAASRWTDRSTAAEASVPESPMKSADVDWPAYNGGQNGDHYSSLAQINRGNVGNLKLAWQFDTGEKGGIQANPVIVGRVLYTYTPSQKVIALDAATGRLIWKFDSGIPGTRPNRGVAYWTDGKQARILAGVMNYLYALDAATGKHIPEFGEGGRIDLRKDLRGEAFEQQSIVLTTPGIVYKDLIIVGGRNPETHPAPPGDIRAFDVRTGALRWRFHTIPHPGEFGYKTWPTDAWKQAGAANNWAGMALDPKRGIVYVPTGSAVFDFYGGDRIGNDLFANTLLALDAETGKRIWHFQGVHHDVWDRDFPAPPALVTVNHKGREVEALAQTTKQGFVYLFDRATGKPLFPVQERKYPASNVPGEATSHTQPLPLLPEPYGRQRLTEDMLTTRTPEAHAWALAEFRKIRSAGQFVPFSLDKQTIVFPGFDGGAEWGGPAVDPTSGILYVNENEMAWTGGLVENSGTGDLGTDTYQSQCAVCHGTNLAGSPPAFPSLVDIHPRLTDKEITDLILQGKGRMPSLTNLSTSQITALLTYLKTPPVAAADTKELATVDRVDALLQSQGKQPANPLGAGVYQQKCAACHGDHLEGVTPSFPMLLGLRQRLTAAETISVIHAGKGLMPAAPEIKGRKLDALLHFLDVSTTAKPKPLPPAGSDRYGFTGYRKFLDPDGYPAIAPPWGTLNAIDLNTGKYLWKIPLGEYPSLAGQGLLRGEGMKATGSENYGGPVVTAGGLLFIGATVYDRKFRAFDSRTGDLLWQTELPFAGLATPSTYSVDGKQFVVIAAAGGRDPKSPTGGEYVAFALP